MTDWLKLLMIAGVTSGFAGAVQAEYFDAGKAEFSLRVPAVMGWMTRAKDLSASSSRCPLLI
jgi:hypothetical protein